MKKFIEAIEDTKDKPNDYQGDFIKEEVEKDHGNAKIKKAKDKCKAKEKSGKTYKYRIHICNHEENKPCTVEDI